MPKDTQPASPSVDRTLDMIQLERDGLRARVQELDKEIHATRARTQAFAPHTIEVAGVDAHARVFGGAGRHHVPQCGAHHLVPLYGRWVNCGGHSAPLPASKRDDAVRAMILQHGADMLDTAEDYLRADQLHVDELRHLIAWASKDG